jgi:hypothetical protein
MKLGSPRELPSDVSRGKARSPDILAWRIGAVIALVLVAVLVVLDGLDRRPAYSQLITLQSVAHTDAELARQAADMRRIARALPSEPGVHATVVSGPSAGPYNTTVEIVARADDIDALRRYVNDVAMAHLEREVVQASMAVHVYHVHDLLLIPLFLGMLLSVSTLQMGARNSEDSPTFTGGAILVHLIALGLAASAYAVYAPNVSARVPMTLFAVVVIASEVLWAFQLPDMSDDRESKSLRRPQLIAIGCFTALALVRFVQPPTG